MIRMFSGRNPKRTLSMYSRHRASLMQPPSAELLPLQMDADGQERRVKAELLWGAMHASTRIVPSLPHPSMIRTCHSLAYSACPTPHHHAQIINADHHRPFLAATSRWHRCRDLSWPSNPAAQGRYPKPQ